MQQGESVPFFRFLAKLGLHSPSEPTKRNLALAILAMTYTMDEVLLMLRADKVAFAETVYNAFLKTRALCPPARHQLAKLFPTVQEFQAKCPDWYAELYEKEPPAPAPWPIETWSRLITSGFCRKERGTTTAFRASPSFAASAPGAPHAVIQGLQMLQHEIRALQPQLDPRRFRFDSPMGPSSSARLDNGATLTFTGPGEAARTPAALADAQGPARARDDDAPGGAEAAGADAPAKRIRVSIDEVSKRILAVAAEPKGEKADEGAGPKAKAKAKAKGHAVKPGVCPLRCQHDGTAKTFKCYWNKLNCKSFPYVSAKEKQRAEKLANDWLAAMGAKHGLAAPAITF